MTTSHILITGAASGFGRLTSESLARAGHTVYATFRDVAGRNARAAEELRAFAPEGGGRVVPVELDVASDDSVERGVKEILERSGGRLDVAVNNAGIGTFGHEEAYTPAQVLALYDVNVVGPHRINRAVLPAMRAQGSGLIVHVTSMIGRTVIPVMGHYCATKFALEATAEAYYYVLRQIGIDSVIVEPGAYPTDFAGHALAGADTARAEAYGPLAQLPQQMGAGLAQMFSAADAPNPQAVADAIVRLVATPAGQRPLRTIVDAHPEGIQAINDLTAQVQAGLLQAFGLGALVPTGAAS